MKNYDKQVLYGHGTPFLIYKTPFGINVSLNGKWLWRARTMMEAKRIVNWFGLNSL